jgi:hypothetical protein
MTRTRLLTGKEWEAVHGAVASRLAPMLFT